MEPEAWLKASLIFDRRPEAYHPEVEEAVRKAMETARNWRAGAADESDFTAIEEGARSAIRAAFGLTDDMRIVFTSSVEEARNQLTKGLAWAADDFRREIVSVDGDSTGFEESAIWCERWGFKSVVLPLNRVGGVNFPEIERAITPRTAVVAFEAATPGSLHQRLPEIRKVLLCAEKSDAETVVDASLDIAARGCIRLAPEGHIDRSIIGRYSMICDGSVLGAPTGVAFFALRSGARFGPLISGGTEQDGLRGGRMNPALIAGLGAAARVYSTRGDVETGHLETLRNNAVKELKRRLPDAVIPKVEAPLPGGLTVIVGGVEGEAVVMLARQRGLAIATGSACQSRIGKPSPALLAAGFSPEEANGALHLAFRLSQTTDDVVRAVAILADVVGQLRQMAGR